jgi:hypothetical protein
MKKRLALFVLSMMVGGCVVYPQATSTDDAGSSNGGSDGGVGSGGGNGGVGGNGPGGQTGIPSGPGDMATMTTTPAPPPPDMAGGTSACIPPGTPTINGNHNQGKACLTCHNGTTAPQFYAAGTIYDGTGAGLPGVTVEINDGKQTVRVVSAASPPGTEGNFYIDKPLGTSLTVRASSCPANRIMPGTASGDCNSCHGPTMRIHVP